MERVVNGRRGRQFARRLIWLEVAEVTPVETLCKIKPARKFAGWLRSAEVGAILEEEPGAPLDAQGIAFAIVVVVRAF